MHRTVVAGSNLSFALAKRVTPSCRESATHLRSASCHPQRSLIRTYVPSLTRGAAAMVTRPVAAPKPAKAAASASGAVHHASGKDFDVIVWGATGFVGQLVCEELASKYARVSLSSLRWFRCVARTVPSPSPTPPSAPAPRAGLAQAPAEVGRAVDSRTCDGQWPAARRRSWSPCARALANSIQPLQCASRPPDLSRNAPRSVCMTPLQHRAELLRLLWEKTGTVPCIPPWDHHTPCNVKASTLPKPNCFIKARSASQQDVPIVVADISDPASLDSMTSRTAAVIALAGPYAKLGTPVVEACIRNGAHYVDLTGGTHSLCTTKSAYQNG